MGRVGPSNSHLLSMLLGAVQGTSSTGCKVAICISVLWTGLNLRETELHARPHSKQMTGGAGFGFLILGASYSKGHRLVFVVGVPKMNLGYQSSGAVSLLSSSLPLSEAGVCHWAPGLTS